MKYAALIALVMVLLVNTRVGLAQQINRTELPPDSAQSAIIRQNLNNLPTTSYSKLCFKTENATINYRLLTPDVKPGKRYPLIITLHNSSRIGTDNESQLEPLARIWLRPAIQQKYAAYVVAPQFSSRSSNYNLDSVRQCLVSKPSADAIEIIQLITELKRSHPQIDARRIYLVGYSMGASTAQNLISRTPDQFAAMVSIAAVPDFTNLPALKSKPIWLVHGAIDTENPYQGSQQMYNALAGSRRLRFTTYTQFNHNQITLPLLESEDIPKWLFKCKLP